MKIPVTLASESPEEAEQVIEAQAMPSEPEVDPTVTEAVPEASTTPDQSGWFKRNRKWLIVVLAMVSFAAGGGAWALMRPADVKQTAVSTRTPTPTPVPTPITKLSPLTGLPVDPALADRPISGVIIENQTDARPQSGLQDAGVVYEALAEGGITRFEAFYLDKRPASIGPVRSVRTYFVDWALEYNAPLAHAGGNADALDEIGPLKMKDENALSFAADAFFRITTRYAPHNLYTTSDKLDALNKRLGFDKPSDFTPAPRKADEPASSPAHPNIHIDYSYNGYQVDYKYDPAANDYARSLAGAPHVDVNTGSQIHVKNVVVEFIPTSYGYTRLGTVEPTVIMKTVGTGKAIVFRDGAAVVGTWKKDSHAGRTILTDADGKEIPLDAGNTWYSIVPTGNNVSY
jgi:hypothetical protein